MGPVSGDRVVDLLVQSGVGEIIWPWGAKVVDQDTLAVVARDLHFLYAQPTGVHHLTDKGVNVFHKVSVRPINAGSLADSIKNLLHDVPGRGPFIRG